MSHDLQFASCAVLVVLAGCSALIDPDEGKLGGGGGSDASIRLLDSGPRIDAGVVIPPGDDAGPPPPGIDAGPPPPPVDAGPLGCSPSEPPRCEGDVLVYCEAGSLVSDDCQSAAAYCSTEAGFARCQPWVCEPGASRCEGFEQAVVCDERGAGESASRCMFGCDFGSGRCRLEDPPPTDACDDLPELGGFFADRVNLCDRSNDNVFQPMGDCTPSSTGTAGDQIFRLEVDRSGTYEISARDDDGRAAIDVVLYLRSTCDAPETQFACSDDIACTDTVVECAEDDWRTGVQVREARIRVALEPGTYYVVVDHFQYNRGGTAFGCGTVRVDAERL